MGTINTLTVRCPRCDLDLEVPIRWSAVPGQNTVTLSPRPELASVKTHMMLHIPPDPGDGIPIAS